jgi:hypothetical protein
MELPHVRTGIPSPSVDHTRYGRRFASWLFLAPTDPAPAWRVVAWWEARRLPFNVIVGTYGVLCLAVFFLAITSSGHLQPGEDAVEPIALIAAPFVINLLYTLGWLVEIPARVYVPGLSPRFGPLLLKLGLGFGLFLITGPAALWAGYRLLNGGQVRW